MSLKSCPTCGHQVSMEAFSCPSCGHPLKKTAVEKQAENTQSSKKAAAFGCLFFFLAFVLLIGVGVNEGSKKLADTAAPTCYSDYTLCKDNKELVNRFKVGKNELSLSTICWWAATQKSQYGEPEDVNYRSFLAGRSYIETGTAILIDNDGMFPNVFGGKVRTRTRCSVDLKTGTATVLFD